MNLDNNQLIRPFVPKTDDGDTFIYTELLDRSKSKGNNVNRLVKSFHHRSQEEFDEQMPAIRSLCELSGARAYTRLAPRSYEKVGKVHVQLVVDAAMSGNWHTMKALYSRALGTVTPNVKYWLFDVDVINAETTELEGHLKLAGHWVATIPSRKGLHYIVKPFDMRSCYTPKDVQLHKDNPTNLYIPDGAA